METDSGIPSVWGPAPVCTGDGENAHLRTECSDPNERLIEEMTRQAEWSAWEQQQARRDRHLSRLEY